MEIAVLSSPTSWYLRDLRRAAGDDLHVHGVTFRELVSEIGSAGTAVTSGALSRGCSAWLVRTMPPGSLEQVVFRMDALGQLEAAGVVVVNSARAIEAAVDKYLALAKLRDAGFLVPRTIVCQTCDQAMDAFERLGCDIVVKPLFGGEGRGIFRVADLDLAYRSFRTLDQLESVLYLQEFVEHEGFDLRLFVAGNRVLGMRRHNADDWRTNVGRGAMVEPITVSDQLENTARQASISVGADIAGVDVLPARDGNQYVLEVNAVPGWQALSRALNVDVARTVLDYVVSRVRSKE